MPEKHFYFSIGTLVGSIIAFFIGRVRHKLQQTNGIIRALYKKDRHWFLFFPIIIFLVGIWGLIPDIIHALGLLPKEVTRNNYFNIFFLHSYLEYVENNYPAIDRVLNWEGEIILFGVSIGIMIYYIRQINRSVATRINAKQKND